MNIPPISLRYTYGKYLWKHSYGSAKSIVLDNEEEELTETQVLT